MPGIVKVAAGRSQTPVLTLQTARCNPVGLNVQTRGATPQFAQKTLWNSRFDHKASIAAKLRETGNRVLADKLDACHQEVTYARCTGCGKVEIWANRCDLMICPTCQPRLAKKRLESVSWWAEKFLQPKHVVLTVRNEVTLTTERVRFLKRQLQSLRRSKFATAKTVRVRKLRELVNLRKVRGERLRAQDLKVTSYPWHGGTWSLETTNEDKGWHLHFHLLIESRFIDGTALAQKWAKLVKQEFTICKVKDCRKHDYLKELLKYVVKPSQLAGWTPAQVASFVHTFTKERTFGVFGLLYKLRSQATEWKKELAKYREVCDCGCNRRKFYTQQEWDVWEIEQQIKYERPPPAMVGELPDRQLKILDV